MRWVCLSPSPSPQTTLLQTLPLVLALALALVLVLVLAAMAEGSRVASTRARPVFSSSQALQRARRPQFPLLPLLQQLGLPAQAGPLLVRVAVLRSTTFPPSSSPGPGQRTRRHSHLVPPPPEPWAQAQAQAQARARARAWAWAQVAVEVEVGVHTVTITTVTTLACRRPEDPHSRRREYFGTPLRWGLAGGRRRRRPALRAPQPLPLLLLPLRAQAQEGVLPPLSREGLRLLVASLLLQERSAHQRLQARRQPALPQPLPLLPLLRLLLGLGLGRALAWALVRALTPVDQTFCCRCRFKGRQDRAACISRFPQRSPLLPLPLPPPPPLQVWA